MTLPPSVTILNCEFYPVKNDTFPIYYNSLDWKLYLADNIPFMFFLPKSSISSVITPRIHPFVSFSPLDIKTQDLLALRAKQFYQIGENMPVIGYRKLDAAIESFEKEIQKHPSQLEYFLRPQGFLE